MEYVPELTEMAERIILKMLPDTEGVVITRGILTAEVLTLGSDHRGVIAVQFGRQGVLPPYDAIGLLTVPLVRSQALIAELLEGGHDDDLA